MGSWISSRTLWVNVKKTMSATWHRRFRWALTGRHILTPIDLPPCSSLSHPLFGGCSAVALSWSVSLTGRAGASLPGITWDEATHCVAMMRLTKCGVVADTLHKCHQQSCHRAGAITPRLRPGHGDLLKSQRWILGPPRSLLVFPICGQQSTPTSATHINCVTPSLTWHIHFSCRINMGRSGCKRWLREAVDFISNSTRTLLLMSPKPRDRYRNSHFSYQHYPRCPHGEIARSQQDSISQCIRHRRTGGEGCKGICL